MSDTKRQVYPSDAQAATRARSADKALLESGGSIYSLRLDARRSAALARLAKKYGSKRAAIEALIDATKI